MLAVIDLDHLDKHYCCNEVRLTYVHKNYKNDLRSAQKFSLARPAFA